MADEISYFKTLNISILCLIAATHPSRFLAEKNIRPYITITVDT